MSTVTFSLLSQAGFRMLGQSKHIHPSSYYQILKRSIDLSIVLSTAIFWLPLMVICAPLIKINSFRGPVLFVQQRTGKGGKRFPMFKFRTMVPDAEAKKAE